MNFSWAMDLDPKGLNNQIKEAIDKRYVTEEDDSLVQFNDTGKYWPKGGRKAPLRPEEIDGLLVPPCKAYMLLTDHLITG